MSDALARDPVFGEVARALQPRAIGRAGADRRGVIGIAVNGAALPDWMRANPYDTVRAEGTSEVRVFVDGRVLERDASRAPEARTLLSAHENHARAPAATRMMGVVNVTPDSFSDGGAHFDPARAIEHGIRLASEGAHILDIGGESTRPGSLPVDADEELRRTLPVVTELARKTDARISIDTQKSSVARAALDAGASIVNDVSAGRFDAAMLPLVAEREVTIVLMHMQGTPRDMQRDPRYGDVVADVTEFLRARAAACLAAGIARERIWIDPGIGFGKALEHNVELLRRLRELRSLGLPILLGVSRKAFIAKIHPPAQDSRERIGGTAAAVAIGVQGGAEILRVHEVAIMAEAAAVARALGG